MCPCELADDREPEPGAAHVPGDGGWTAGEAFEQPRHEGVGHAVATVAHAQDGVSSCLGEAQTEGRLAVLEGVGEVVHDDLLDVVAVGHDEQRVGVVHDDGRTLDVLEDAGDDLVQVQHPGAHDELAGVDA